MISDVSELSLCVNTSVFLLIMSSGLCMYITLKDIFSFSKMFYCVFVETAPSTYVIKIQITYKTSFFAFYCKDAHEKAIARSIDELTRQIDYYCNNQFVAVGPIVINSTTTTTSSFDVSFVLAIKDIL